MQYWERLNEERNVGREESERNIASLYAKMENDGASAEELSRAVKDPEYRVKMYGKYNILER